MWPFGGAPGPRTNRVPTARVVTLASQGMPQSEIINTLKNEGYNPAEVDSAMKQALRSAASGPPTGIPPASNAQSPPQPLHPPSPSLNDTPSSTAPPGAQPSETAQTAQNDPGSLPPPPGGGVRSPPGEAPTQEVPGLGMPVLPGDPGFMEQTDSLPSSPGSPGARGDDIIPRLRESMTKREDRDDKRRMIEELVEGIISERWSEFRMEIDSTKSQFDDIKKRLDLLEQSVKSAESEKASGFTDIEKKIESYDQSMSEMSSRVVAMEGAMKSSMTPMMQAIRSLTNAVKELKGDTTNENTDNSLPPQRKESPDMDNLIKE